MGFLLAEVGAPWRSTQVLLDFSPSCPSLSEVIRPNWLAIYCSSLTGAHFSHRNIKHFPAAASVSVVETSFCPEGPIPSLWSCHPVTQL